MMKKTPNFNVGDKVFAKVKGYPPWPACIIAENGKKYNVKFYGTGETGMIKVEDIAYYLRNKDKFQKPLKRKDYVDAFEQIEEAIKQDGGDGDPSAGDSILDDSSISLNSSNTSLNTSAKVVKKTIKRKRSVSDKSSNDQPTPSPKTQTPKTQTPKKRLSKSEEVVEEVATEEPPASPKKSPKVKTTEPQKKDIVFVPTNESESALDRDGLEIIEADERSEESELNIQIVSEKALKNNITYAKHVKEKESIYKGKPVEPREDFSNQVLPVKLPSGIMGGIKLHLEWPLKYETEYARAMYDEAVAVRVLEEKQKFDSGNMAIVSDLQLFNPKIGMSSNFVTECLYLRDIHAKRNRIDRLKIEADLMGIDSKIKNSLGLDKADPTQAITYLETMCNLNFDELMLKKHPHVVDMVRRLRKYVGNTKEWNLSDESLNEFVSQAEKIRATADNVYAKFKKVVDVPENAASFWDGFTDILSTFREECKDMTDAQIYLLCAEPTSRRAFFDHLEEMESEKENSSGVANSESDPVVVNGGGETPAVVDS